METLVKVLDGCGTNGERWVFSAGLTNLEVGVTVTDSVTGAGKRYFNAQGEPYPPKLDLAYQECDAAAATEAPPAAKPNVASWRGTGATATGSGCEPSPTTLCLLDGRFRVEGTWRTADDRSGPARAAPLTADTGTFWFFDPAVVETVVKLVDGCGTNGRRWLFAAGLTNVELRWRVTDTATGAVRDLLNPLGTSFAPVQDIEAFAGCP